MKIYQFFFPIFMILQSCFGTSGAPMSEFNETLNNITFKAAKKIQAEMPFLRPIGFGGSMKNEEEIRFKTLEFDVHKKINKDEGVVIISKIIDEYLKVIYLEKKMEKYLNTYGFTYKNLKITLYIYDEQNHDIYHPGIGIFRLRDGVIFYRTVSKSEKYYYKTESYTEEPFEEAAKRVGVWHND